MWLPWVTGQHNLQFRDADDGRSNMADISNVADATLLQEYCCRRGPDAAGCSLTWLSQSYQHTLNIANTSDDFGRHDQPEHDAALQARQLHRLVTDEGCSRYGSPIISALAITTVLTMRTVFGLVTADRYSSALLPSPLRCRILPKATLRRLHCCGYRPSFGGQWRMAVESTACPADLAQTAYRHR